MPLIIVCGLPSSGKTTRVRELLDYLAKERPSVKIELVSEEVALIDKERGYENSKEEKIVCTQKAKKRNTLLTTCSVVFKKKKTRGILKSLVEKYVSQTRLVIFDSMNYIKGFRYELYCLARAARTPSCVLFADTSRDLARGWNESARHYSPALFEQLSAVFERPNARARWDRPLFAVSEPMEPLPLDAIAEWLDTGKAAAVAQATMEEVVQDPNYVHHADNVTKSIVQALLDARRTMMPGELVRFANFGSSSSAASSSSSSSEGEGLSLRLTASMTAGALRRVRRDYLKLITQLDSATHIDQSRMPQAFVDYIESQLK
jgi:protein KTI12